MKQVVPVLNIQISLRNYKMSKIIDITVPLYHDIPTWPGSIGFQLTKSMSLEAGDIANVSKLYCDVHTGTHVDAPAHFIKQGKTVEQLPLDILIGPVYVAYLPGVSVVTDGHLQDLALPSGTKRLLLRTTNSKLWEAGINEFKKDYVALTPEASEWVVKKGIRLIGIDYLSIQRYNDSSYTHEILLKEGVIILEGLNLSAVKPGYYRLICLPLRLVDADGAPARAVLQNINNSSNRYK